MTKKSSMRLISSIFCILLAVIIAVIDFIHTINSESATFEQSAMINDDENQSTITDFNSLENQDKINQALDESPEIEEVLPIFKGDTMIPLLIRAGISTAQANSATEQLKKVFNLRSLRPDHEIIMRYVLVKEESNRKDLISLFIRPSIDIEVHVQRDHQGNFQAHKNQVQLKHDVHVSQGIIRNSLYIDAGKQNVPPKILHEMTQAFAYDVDFQRSFHSGDRYGVIYDTYSNPDTMQQEAGNLRFALLQLQDRTYRIYRFKNASGIWGFYNEKGESIKKGLLRTPIDGARISSTFGNRRHPILGYTKMHKGLDFAAPTGTPIMAAGDGVVMRAEFFSTYGRYILIRHNQEFSTAYAHLSGFAKSIKVGSHVRQGQIIGYVGATGRVSGPHLHYELLRFKQQINPNSIKMMPSARLAGKELANFQHQVHKANLAYEKHKEDQDESSENSLENESQKSNDEAKFYPDDDETWLHDEPSFNHDNGLEI